MRKGLIILAAILVFSLAVAGESPADGTSRLESPSWEHPFGTDELGRDLMKRVGTAVLVSFSVALPVTIISLAGGMLLSYGFFLRRFPSSGVLALSDTLRSIPAIIIALFLNALSGPGILKLIAALSIGNIPVLARLCHSRIAILRSEGPVLAAETMGIGKGRIFISHILPHLMPYLALEAVSVFSSAILTEASLSYLGCGVPPTLPSLGSILSDSRGLPAPHMIIFPALFLLLIGISLEIIARSLKPDSSFD